MSYKIKSGDTLHAIAKRNNVTVADLVKANPQIKDPAKIKAGWVLTMPMPAKLPGASDGFSTAPRRPSGPQPKLTGISEPPKTPEPVALPEPPELAPPALPAMPDLPAALLTPAALPEPPAAPVADPLPPATTAMTFTTPGGAKSVNGKYTIPACTFPTFDALSKTQQGMLGPNGREVYGKLGPEERACFLNITGKLAKAGIDLSGLQISEFNSDRFFLEPQSLEKLQAQLEHHPDFKFDKPEGKFHPGMTEWGVREDTDFNSVQVGLGPKGGFIDIDRGNPKVSVAALFTHLSEVLTPGKTDPFAIGKQLGPDVTGYSVQ